MNDSNATLLTTAGPRCRKENPETACDEVAEMKRRAAETGSPLYSRQHRQMYDFPTLHWCGGRRVLEVGVGYGYGIERLASVAKAVVGIDILPSNIEHAARTYSLANVHYEVADICTWAAADESFDVAVMVDVIEHITDDAAALRNVHRLLRPRGMLFVSTVWPRLADDGKPLNRCHCREYFPREFRDLVRCVFPNVVIHAYAERNLIVQAQKDF